MTGSAQPTRSTSERATPIYEFRVEETDEGKLRAVELKTVAQDLNL